MSPVSLVKLVSLVWLVPTGHLEGRVPLVPPGRRELPDQLVPVGLSVLPVHPDLQEVLVLRDPLGHQEIPE